MSAYCELSILYFPQLLRAAAMGAETTLEQEVL
jgi:hypothetical protein